MLSGAALFQLATGVLNIAYWYARCRSRSSPSHYWGPGWLIGALLLHIAVKLPIIRGGAAPAGRSSRGAQPDAADPPGRCWPPSARPSGSSRVATVGQTVRPLTALSVLAPRRPDVGPQGLPVNTVRGGGRRRPTRVTTRPTGWWSPGRPAGSSCRLADLAALPQTTVSLPITCVEGWSATAALDRRPGRATCSTGSAAPAGPPYGRVAAARQPVRHVRAGPPTHAADPLTLLALRRQRRAAAPRPRLPGAADRAEPARRHADQVGRHPHRGPAMNGVAMKAVRAGLLGLGLAAMAYAVTGVLTDDGDESGPARCCSWSRWS